MKKYDSDALKWWQLRSFFGNCSLVENDVFVCVSVALFTAIEVLKYYTKCNTTICNQVENFKSFLMNIGLMHLVKY